MRTTHQAQFALPSSAAIFRRLHDQGRRIADRARNWQAAHFVAPHGTGRKLLAALVLFSVLLGASEVAAAGRTDAKRTIGPNASVQGKATMRMVSGRSTRSDQAVDPSATFRAEDIVPDICKGCSS